MANIAVNMMFELRLLEWLRASVPHPAGGRV